MESPVMAVLSFAQVVAVPQLRVASAALKEASKFVWIFPTVATLLRTKYYTHRIRDLCQVLVDVEDIYRRNQYN